MIQFKKTLAQLCVTGLFFMTTSIALAHTFNDVPSDAWYFDYIDTLVNDEYYQGIIDTAEYFRPGDPINRAELVKMIITAIDGLYSYEAPARPTFKDVPDNTWYYKYVEAAVQLGIVSGYTDEEGNLTGEFGPSNLVNRAEAAKIIVKAFQLPIVSHFSHPFPDVSENDWFYDYIVAAYNQGVISGYENGMFTPGDSVTRAQIAKMIILGNPIPQIN